MEKRRVATIRENHLSEIVGDEPELTFFSIDEPEGSYSPVHVDHRKPTLITGHSFIFSDKLSITCTCTCFTVAALLFLVQGF